jgi:hypothetical protein
MGRIDAHGDRPAHERRHCLKERDRVLMARTAGMAPRARKAQEPDRPGWRFRPGHLAVRSGRGRWERALCRWVCRRPGIISVHLNEPWPDAVREWMPGFAYQLGILFAAPTNNIEYELRDRFEECSGAPYCWCTATPRVSDGLGAPPKRRACRPSLCSVQDHRDFGLLRFTQDGGCEQNSDQTQGSEGE